MKVKISTPEQTVYSGEADSVVVEAEKGQLCILPQHARLVTFLRRGPLKLVSSAGEKKFSVAEGVMRIEDDHITILTSSVVAA